MFHQHSYEESKLLTRSSYLRLTGFTLWDDADVDAFFGLCLISTHSKKTRSSQRHFLTCAWLASPFLEALTLPSSNSEDLITDVRFKGEKFGEKVGYYENHLNHTNTPRLSCRCRSESLVLQMLSARKRCKDAPACFTVFVAI